MKNILILLLFPLFASSQIDSIDIRSQHAYAIYITTDTIPAIITFIDYNYALNIVKYIFGYEVQLTIKDNYPILLSTLANYVNNSNRYLNVTNEVVEYLDIDKKRLPENYKVLQTYKR